MQSRRDELGFRRREANGRPEGLLVLLHGRGADENDLFPLLDMLDPDGRLLGVTPRAPLHLPPGGAHWYELGELGYPNPETFGPTYAQLSGWLDAFSAETGIEAGRTVIGGFSQGAVMTYALALGLGRPKPAAALAFSGFIPIVDGFQLDLAQPLPPIAIGHGSHDPVIGAEWGRRARGVLEAAGASVFYRESALPHTLDPQFLIELRPWLQDALASSPSGFTPAG